MNLRVFFFPTAQWKMDLQYTNCRRNKWGVKDPDPAIEFLSNLGFLTWMPAEQARIARTK